MFRELPPSPSGPFFLPSDPDVAMATKLGLGLLGTSCKVGWWEGLVSSGGNHSPPGGATCTPGEGLHMTR